MPTMWRPLPPFSNGLPPLFVSPSFGASAYTLHVTDLANVWSETLDRKAIFGRSIQEDTSIDLTEGPDQMAILLQKLQAAVDPSSPDHHQTSLTLAAASASSSADDLALLINCTLPGGLKPLKWPVNLTKLPPASLASVLVLPLVQAQHSRTREVQSLAACLKEKDAVINKLVDKLAATGTGLESVFNALSGKRKVTRAFADTQVKGLARFDPSEWRATVSRGAAPPDDVVSLVQKAFGDSEYLDFSGAKLSVHDNLNGWWRDLGTEPVATTVSRPTPKGSEEPQAPELKPVAADDDGDVFQLQATPPHLASRRAAQSITGEDDDTTEEEEAAIIPDSYPVTSRQQEKRPARIGAIGGIGPRAAKATSRSSHSRDAEDDDATASESDHEAAPSSPPKRAGKQLGIIGGKPSRTRSSSPVALPQPSQHDDAATDSDDTSPEKIAPSLGKSPSPARAVAQRKRGGLGVIGGRNRVAQKSSSPVAGEEDVADVPSEVKPRAIGTIGKRPRAGTPASPGLAGGLCAEPKLTDEQKAAQRRAELAKELERKSAAAPSKKKRRF